MLEPNFFDHGDGILEWEMLDNLTATNANEYKSVLLDKLQTLDVRAFIFHFGSGCYIDSAGIAALLTLQRKFKGLKTPIVLCTQSEHIREVFFLTKLDVLFPLESTVEASLSKIRANF